MKIIDSTMALQSSHNRVVQDVARESLRVWQEGSEPAEQELRGERVGQLRSRAMALLQHPPAPPRQVEAATGSTGPVDAGRAVSDGEEPLDTMQDLEVSLLKLLVERFTGRSIRVTTPAELKSESEATAARDSRPQPADGGEAREGWGMVYENYRSHFESEQTSFQAQGVVKTADGREIAIDLQLNMSREFLSEEFQSLRAGDALKDPLVVNFSGNAAELTQQQFSFDIDADGNSDQIHFVTSGSGFLALDKNQDGVINDGSELFGALSGDGFADLARYDSDGNGWIDEGDAIFDSLRIWSKDGQGQDRLVALGAQGIGAIYLGHITTPFELKDGDNRLTGVVRDSGLYLGEEGGGGTLQQIDLVV